ncbi:hypothetical protein EDD17DRAFT_1521136 [Pisolithus thermaeus]|nr:hypothetical protein EDD17DRAFT_1521136 [Pisolithus thermaeus]
MGCVIRVLYALLSHNRTQVRASGMSKMECKVRHSKDGHDDRKVCGSYYKVSIITRPNDTHSPTTPMDHRPSTPPARTFC